MPVKVLTALVMVVVLIWLMLENDGLGVEDGVEGGVEDVVDDNGGIEEAGTVQVAS